MELTTCPEEHIVAYKNLMLPCTTNPALLCNFFPTTLTGLALIWYTLLLVGSINTFAQLKAKFFGRFYYEIIMQNTNYNLRICIFPLLIAKIKLTRIH